MNYDKGIRFCPYCGVKHDDYTGLFDGDVPTPEESLSICFECAEVSIFIAADPGLRKPTEEEKKQIESQPEVGFAIRRLEEVKNQRQNWKQ